MNLPVTISQLTRQLKSIIENEFSFVNVLGEISNFKHHSSGHFYFTLKDDKAQISASMWNSRNKYIFFTPENGMKIVVKGRITLYESKGTYQIDVFDMKPAGAGELQLAFEKLKQKLFEEGLFEESYKKPIPDFPKRVGIITSETGAALQDFIRVTQRRYPIVNLVLIHANVQGYGSADSICSAIMTANNPDLNLEILIIARGGGSIEDLWSFNEEKVAREIFKSRIPVVSAIGHEVDFTICDFVADLRAATPSAAAEMIFPDKMELIKKINEHSCNLSGLINSKINNLKYTLENISNNYYFKRPMDLINENKFRLDELEKGLEHSMKKKLLNLERSLNSSEKLLNSLNPDQVLKRGFSIIIKDGKYITRKRGVKADDNVEIKFYDGESSAKIKE
ncbi:MAG: exodeoxyribonuclease VII large subunit [Bacteroidota bacterium]|nr:exodeoxyribonuclease VII large subunit [Bacteroidota bacterium]